MQSIPSQFLWVSILVSMFTLIGCQSRLDTNLPGAQNPSDQRERSESEREAAAALKAQGLQIEVSSTALEPSQVQIEDVAGSNLGTGQGSGSQVEMRQVEASDAKIEQILSDFNAETTREGISINLPESILFDFDQAELKRDAQPTLEKINQLLTHYGDAPVAIKGHTDSKGSDAYNQSLSEKRAVAVKNYLTSKFGVDSSRLRAVGLGESQPVAPNTKPGGADNPEGRQKNRRVEVIIDNQ